MRTLLCLGFLIVSIPRTFAESPNILDILPENAAGSITVRLLADLKKKGDTFLKDAEWNLPWRPSQIMEFGFTIVGNPKGVDHDGFVSAVFVNKGDSDAPHGIGIVLIFQVSDQDAIARDYELKPEDIKPGKILKIKSPSSWFSLSYLAVQDKKFYIGESKQALESVMKSKPLRGQLTAQQQKDFAQGDLFLHINPRGIYGAGWKEEVKDWSKELEEKKDPFVDAEFMKLMIESLPTLKFGLAQIRVEDGLNLRVTASFEDNDKAKKLLKALGSASPASNLNGLPEGDVLFAQSAKGDGTQTASLIRTLLHFAFNYNDATHDLISSTDRPMYLGVFAEIWKHLRGARMALYQNPDPNKGLFSMCADRKSVV